MFQGYCNLLSSLRKIFEQISKMPDINQCQFQIVFSFFLKENIVITVGMCVLGRARRQTDGISFSVYHVGLRVEHSSSGLVIYTFTFEPPCQPQITFSKKAEATLF